MNTVAAITAANNAADFSLTLTVLELSLNGVSLLKAPIVELVARSARNLRLPHNAGLSR
jgi:hypothetical protein